MTARRPQKPAAAPNPADAVADTRASRGHGATPEGQRTTVLGLLLAGHSTDSAAKAIGVEGSTVRRWLSDDPAFAAQFSAGLAEIQAATTRQLIAAKGVAVETLVVQARAGDVAAARALLQHGEPVRVNAAVAAAVVGTSSSPREPSFEEVESATLGLVRVIAHGHPESGAKGAALLRAVIAEATAELGKLEGRS